MTKVTKLIPKSDRCIFCGKPATKLCDMPVSRWQWVGHAPKIGGLVDLTDAGVNTTSCDKQMCDGCARDMGGGIDICPDCAKKVKGR